MGKLALFGFVFIVLLFGLTDRQMPAPTPRGVFPKEYLGEKADIDFAIFFTGDIRGNFEPCG